MREYIAACLIVANIWLAAAMDKYPGRSRVCLLIMVAYVIAAVLAITLVR